MTEHLSTSSTSEGLMEPTCQFCGNLDPEFEILRRDDTGPRFAGTEICAHCLDMVREALLETEKDD